MNQGVADESCFLAVFKQRLIDMFIQEWSAVIRGKDRYSIYSVIKHNFEREKYLNNVDIYCFRVAFTQLRLGVLPINANVNRYSDNIAARYCPVCTNDVENIEHFFYCTVHCMQTYVSAFWTIFLACLFSDLWKEAMKSQHVV